MRCRAEGLFASTVVPEGIPPKAALARRTLWLVKRSSVVVGGGAVSRTAH